MKHEIRRDLLKEGCKTCPQLLDDHCEGCCIDFEAGVHKGKFCGKKGNGIGKVIRR